MNAVVCSRQGSPLTPSRASTQEQLMNTETYSLNYTDLNAALNAWSDSRTRIIAESAKKATNKAPDMHWESWTFSSIPAEPEVLQVGHQADMQRGTEAVSQYSQQRSPESLPMKQIGLHMAVIECHQNLPLLKLITCCVEAIHAVNTVLWQPGELTQNNRQTNRLLYLWPPAHDSGNECSSWRCGNACFKSINCPYML